jgi:hypothetical protein
MRNTFDILKFAAASKNDQLNSMANSIDIPIKTRVNPVGLNIKTEMNKSQVRMPADMNKVAAAVVSPRTGINMLSKSTKQSGITQLSKGTGKSGMMEGNMQSQLDSSQFGKSINKASEVSQGFGGTVASRRTPGLAEGLKA